MMIWKVIRHHSHFTSGHVVIAETGAEAVELVGLTNVSKVNVVKIGVVTADIAHFYPKSCIIL